MTPSFATQAKEIVDRIDRIAEPSVSDLQHALVELTRIHNEIMFHLKAASGETQERWLTLLKEENPVIDRAMYQIMDLARYCHPGRYLEFALGVVRSPVLVGRHQVGEWTEQGNRPLLLSLAMSARRALQVIPTIDRSRLGELVDALREKGVDEPCQ